MTPANELYDDEEISYWIDEEALDSRVYTQCSPCRHGGHGTDRSSFEPAIVKACRMQASLRWCRNAVGGGIRWKYSQAIVHSSL